MRINNYRGTIADRPLDTTVVDGAVSEQTQLPANKPAFMEQVLAQLNKQNNIVPAGDIPVYNKGRA